MKSNEGKSFKVQILSNIFYSLIITVLIVFFVAWNVFRLSSFLSLEANLKNGVIDAIASFDTVVVILFTFFGIGIFILVLWILERRAFNNIEKFSDAMSDIASGDLAVQLDIEGDDEFSYMAANLNSMVTELGDLIERERESEKAKTELITNVAHDLRTPLTSIIGYLELVMNKKDMTDEMQKQYVSIAYTKSKKLQQLIDDLFSFTKLADGRITMKMSRMDLVKLLEQLITEFYPSFQEKMLSYDLHSNVSSVMITADAKLLARLFDNLINNAIKYGADGKKIDVKVHASSDRVMVSVINYGKVIPESDIPHIFNRFYRVEQSRSTRTGGTGLGLAIAKNIVEMHSGDIKVTSDENGTVFTVILPIDQDMAHEKIFPSIK